MTTEQGKPLAEAAGEVRASADQFDWFADEARRIYGRTIDGHSRDVRLYTIRQPIGPVAAFTAWNFPALLPARKIAAALAAGCSIIVKPAKEAPQTALELARALHDAGLPAGVLNVVLGDSSSLSAQLIGSDVIRKVSLTGSVPVGAELLRLCAEKITPATMELGGHAPVLVFDDADVERAAAVSVTAKFRNAGQVCISPTRFFVQDGVREAFTTAVQQRVEKLRIGDGRTPGVDVGPLANERRVTMTTNLVSDAVAKGARLVTGGARPEGFPRGYFFQPTVLADVTEGMEIMHEEPFGPLLPIIGFSDMEEGISRANAATFGLAGYIFTERTRTATLAVEGLEVGMVGVNNMVIATAEAPFGGIKQSGYGREGGSEGIESYLVTKYVNVAL
jgi:succinate-semialdehyde dehydrogenase / glutarate-semialdehyde dehydrogenase